ncbi:UNVERIFIED_CONTAM: hypothetical protein GTU68_062612, partial [Idotea baltica]|nr:hypothetical protein [Idotea baltica]
KAHSDRSSTTGTAVRQIYLDYNATTPIAPSVLEAMNPFLTGHYGNPSCAYTLGRAAKEAIADARSKVAGVLACAAEEIVFTSGGTESNNMAIKGVMFRYTPGDAHLIISQVEHPAVAAPADFLQRMGYDVTEVACDANGVVQLEEIAAAIRPNTRLVSVMHANNETGVIQPINEISLLCKGSNILLHTDASQSVGKIPTFVQDLGVDMLTMAAHKFYGPKGVGALYVKSGLSLEGLLHGGGQVSGAEILGRIPELCASTGSACHSTGKIESSTLTAMGKDLSQIAGTLRLSCGWYTSQDEIDRAASLLIDAWENLAGQPGGPAQWN